MDISFIVQDVFSLTRPQWKLASNFEEASRAFQLAVAQDQKTSGLGKNAESADADSESDDGIDDGEAEAEAEAEADADAEGIAEAEGEDESDSEEEAEVSHHQTIAYGPGPLTSMKLDPSGDAIAATPSTDSEEESIVVTREEEEVDPEDEADFEREYAKMMAESLESRKHERKSTFDIPLPMRRKERETTTANESWADETASPSTTPSGTVAFSLLTKRGNRQQVSFSRFSSFTKQDTDI
jgi:regulator of nonsense transcripts 2